MLILPSPPNRARLRSFSLALGLMSASTLACLSLLAPGPWFVIGLCLGLTVVGVGLFRPHLIAVAYRIWNSWSAHYMRALRFLLKSACYYLVVSVGERTSASLQLERPSTFGSQWLASERVAQSNQPHDPDNLHRNWKYSYIAWAIRSRKWWALGLLPFLIVLAAIDSDTESTLPLSTYTLT